ncbi:MAG: 30S ribosomal protein S10 [Candidatus Delongbacteria bacterium]|nr:30S ribosomal protein S10 [Candidatus Delongbacteria bacterium]MCG2760007.1 30S ribosomal protein S10 [Candidatus Delongbacteria bacterium]
MASQKIKIKLKSYDYHLIDISTEKIIKKARETGAIISGPVPLPTKKTIYTVLRSPHVNKKSREQFEKRIYKRLVEILNSKTETMEALTKLELPAGVSIEVKVV